MKADNLSTNLRSERYLDIIIKGCEYYKVQSECINRLKNEQIVIPRKQSHQFQSFTDIPSNVFYFEKELVQHNGNDPSWSLWTSINGRILKYKGLLEDDYSGFESQKRLYTYLESEIDEHKVYTNKTNTNKTASSIIEKQSYRLSKNKNNYVKQLEQAMMDNR